MTSTPRFVPKIGLLALVIFGLSYMAPSVVFYTFGVISSVSEGTAPTAYVVATLAMTLTALSYAKLARRIPNSGSVYVYARKLLDSRVGFLAGWVLLMDYLFLPMVAWLLSAVYLNAQFPALPTWLWLLLLITVCTVINALGIVLADRVNGALLAITAIGLLILLGACILQLVGQPSTVSLDPIWNANTSIGAITAAAAIAAYSFLGFDAVATLSEEVKNPEKNVPRGIVLSVLIGGAIFFVISLLMQWIHPGGTFESVDTAGFAIAQVAAGSNIANVINTLIIVGGFGACVAVQAGTSRLLFVMGRDGVLPRPVFGRLNMRFRTPIVNLVIIGAIGMLGVFLSIAEATSFINFGAFLAFTVVNVCVIALWIRMRRESGRGSIFGYIVLPALGALVDLYLLTQLSGTAMILGSLWLAVGVVYLAILTKGFRRQPPQLYLSEAEAEGAVRAQTQDETETT